ncbi:MAG: AAA family ATPase [Leptospiraceae bacterium]|nr:AAA family ATPase [Leptospiraceae bacterium]
MRLPKFYKERISFQDLKREILLSYDDKNINVHYDSFPREYDVELESAYISKFIQLKRDETLPEVKGKQNEAVITRHFIFYGNPGTGKSTAARLLGYFFKYLQILKKGHFKEVSREDLVGDVIGATESKTLKALNDAHEGVLFINEAHQLISEDRKDFGQIAIQVIMKYMEDKRGSIVVIFDGIKEPMEKLLNVHPGLRDRFSRKVHFEDLDDDKLIAISKTLLGEYQYELEESSIPFFRELIQNTRNFYSENNYEFANIRTIRNLLDRIIDSHSKRIYNLNKIENEDLLHIKKEDIIDVMKQKY